MKPGNRNRKMSMHRFVTETLSRKDALGQVASGLVFPWPLETKKLSLMEAIGKRLGEDVFAPEEHPPFDRSLRDGYALNSRDIIGASTGAPVFLKVKGAVPMGVQPDFSLSPGEAASISTGGFLPEGSDAVLMIEDTSLLGNMLEVRRSLQSGDNVILKGEEIKIGDRLLSKGSLLDFRSINLLSAFGFSEVPVFRIKIAVISTGDELVPPETKPLPAGKIRDTNSGMIASILQNNGFSWTCGGIVPDNPSQLKSRVKAALEGNDVILLSGGSSVSARDFTSEAIASLEDPGLIVRGLNISPGKPTMVGGNRRKRKLAVGLPGHPLSCAIVMWTFVLPLMISMITGQIDTERNVFKKVVLELAKDLYGRTGVEEFFPACLENDRIVPAIGKSGYIASMVEATGLVRVPVDQETIRKGTPTEVWLW